MPLGASLQILLTTWAALCSSTSTMSNGPATLTRRRGSIDVVDAKVAVNLATAQTYSENVFLFVPNLIGTLPPRLSRPRIHEHVLR